MNLPLISTDIHFVSDAYHATTILSSSKSISEPEIYPPSFVGHGPLLSKRPAIDVSGCSKLHPEFVSIAPNC